MFGSFLHFRSVMLPFSFILVAPGTRSGNPCFSNELFCHGHASFSLDWRLVVGVKYTRPFSSLVRPVMSKYEMSQMQNYIINSGLIQVGAVSFILQIHLLQRLSLYVLRAL
jgi:hypothetical protein